MSKNSSSIRSYAQLKQEKRNVIARIDQQERELISRAKQIPEELLMAGVTKIISAISKGAAVKSLLNVAGKVGKKVFSSILKDL